MPGTNTARARTRMEVRMKPLYLRAACRNGLLAMILLSAIVPLGDGFASATRGLYAVGLMIALWLYWDARDKVDA